MQYQTHFASATRAYTPSAIALHWFMALALAANFVLGLTMSDLTLSPQKLQLYSWHKWAGITLLGLVTLRLIGRSLAISPAPLSTSIWQQRLAKFSHFLLYLLMFVIPISGWLMSSAAGFTVTYLGLLPLPDLVSKNKPLFELLKQTHETLNFALLTLVVIHTLAALKHHFIEKDATLSRMLPWLRTRNLDKK